MTALDRLPARVAADNHLRACAARFGQDADRQRAVPHAVE